MEATVDIVIPWVDGSDRNWKNKKEKWTGILQNVESKSLKDKSYDGDMRYREYGTLKYLLRSIEKNASWINHIYVITDNQTPEWLNVNNKKITIVDHTEFIPKEYLPTFNTNTIELNLHRIKGLSEHFILVNDDMIFNNVTKKADFFRNGVPVDNLGFTIIPSDNSFSHILVNNMLIINRMFSKKEVLAKNFTKVFNVKNGWKLVLRSCLAIPWTGINGLYNPHISVPYLKSSFEYIWEKEFKILNETCAHKTRRFEDVSDWLIRYFQLCSGKFLVGKSNIGKFIEIDEYSKLCKEFKDGSGHKVVCINDVEKKDVSFYAERLSKLLDNIFPKLSEFEKID